MLNDYISSIKEIVRLAQAEMKTEINKSPKAFMAEDQIKAIQAKEHLTLKEGAIFLNISPLTLRRWTLAGKVISQRSEGNICFESKI